jgi:hypothetical protein
MSAAERIFEEALELPESEREELATRLMDSLDAMRTSVFRVCSARTI